MIIGCGADMTNPTGSFVSPNYPNQYSHNAECFWTITISQGSRIHLTFVDFNFEQHASCQYDYVEVSITHISLIFRKWHDYFHR